MCCHSTVIFTVDLAYRSYDPGVSHREYSREYLIVLPFFKYHKILGLFPREYSHILCIPPLRVLYFMPFGLQKGEDIVVLRVWSLAILVASVVRIHGKGTSRTKYLFNRKLAIFLLSHFVTKCTTNLSLS